MVLGTCDEAGKYGKSSFDEDEASDIDSQLMKYNPTLDNDDEQSKSNSSLRDSNVSTLHRLRVESDSHLVDSRPCDDCIIIVLEQEEQLPSSNLAGPEDSEDEETLIYTGDSDNDTATYAEDDDDMSLVDKSATPTSRSGSSIQEKIEPNTVPKVEFLEEDIPGFRMTVPGRTIKRIMDPDQDVVKEKIIVGQVLTPKPLVSRNSHTAADDKGETKPTENPSKSTSATETIKSKHDGQVKKDKKKESKQKHKKTKKSKKSKETGTAKKEEGEASTIEAAEEQPKKERQGGTKKKEKRRKK